MIILDITVAILLIIGGLNWGLVGLFNFNLVEAILGHCACERVIYAIVGGCALYKLMRWKTI